MLDGLGAVLDFEGHFGHLSNLLSNNSGGSTIGFEGSQPNPMKCVSAS
jgi:hypothetical protein